MVKLVTRVDDDLARAIDELVAAGAFTSRSDTVRVALSQLIDRHRRDEIGQALRALADC